MSLDAVNDKEIVRDLLRRLPEQASLHEIAREIEFIAAVREGLEDADQGRLVPLDTVRVEMASWLIP